MWSKVQGLRKNMPTSDATPGTVSRFLRVGTLEEVRAKRMVVVQAGRCPLLVVCDGSRVFALDNRCPHLGFPLHRGTIDNGVLTCHWHHARFDVSSGGTFDLWADDVPTAEIQLRDGEVWVATELRFADGAAHWRNRLRAGMEHDIALVVAKAVLGLNAEGTPQAELVRDAVLFGARNRDGWGTGLTILTALANLMPELPEEEAYLALFHGICRVAEDCEGRPPRRDRQPFSGDARPFGRLADWLRHWTRGRQRDAAERTLLTAIDQRTAPADLAEMMLVAATDRYFADGGHALDFINKAFECLDIIGWEHASVVLPSVIDQMVEARGGEESNAWRQPVDLIALCEAAFARLPAELERGTRCSARFASHGALAQSILLDDPGAIVAAVGAAVADGARPSDLSRALAYAAALRVARFGTSNEFSDWVTAHHVFTYCNALHQMLKRIDAGAKRPVNPEAVRGVFHGAMRVYMIRFLNVPAARLPDEIEDRFDDLPVADVALQSAFLAALDRQGAVGPAARIIARYLDLGHAMQPLVGTLAKAVLREDADFHTYQMLEAAVRQAQEWTSMRERRHILVAAARYIAAHSPTERARLQTAMVARRLSRGLSVHESIPDPDH